MFTQDYKIVFQSDGDTYLKNAAGPLVLVRLNSLADGTYELLLDGIFGYE